MAAIIEAAQTISQASRFAVAFATTRSEIIETQQLRYRIFAGELGARINGGALRIDADEYDPYCRHLTVRDRASGRLIACTRILTDDQAAKVGGFYSAGEFDLAMLDTLPGRMIEIGRTCVDAEFRSGAVIATLWQGLAGFFTAHGYEYLFGCASIGLEDGGAQAHAILQQIRERHMAPDRQRVHPYYPLPAADSRVIERVRMPPLLKAYLSLGAKACGDAHWDREFNCADIFMLLNVSDMCPRYARHFVGHEPRGERLKPHV